MPKPLFIPARLPPQQVIVVPLDEESWFGDAAQMEGDGESAHAAGDAPAIADTDGDSRADEAEAARPAVYVADAQSLLPARMASAADNGSDPPGVLMRREPPPQHELIPFAAGGDLTLGFPPYPLAPRPRRWPVVVLVAILALVVANIGFTIISQWQSRQSVEELRSELTAHRDGQMEMLIEEIRREVRSRALADTLQLRTELTAIVEAQSRRQSEELLGQLQRPGAQAAEGASDQAPAEAQQASARSRSTRARAAATPKPTPDQKRASSAASDNAVTASASDAAESAAPDVVFFIDASTMPGDAMTMVVSELRRAIDQVGKRRRWTILVFDNQQLIEVPQQSMASGGDGSSASIASAMEDTELPPTPCADIGEALRHTLSTDPLDLYLFASDVSRRGGGRRGADPLAVLREANQDRATRIHAIQFFARDADDLLLKIARENGGTYTLVTPPAEQ